MLGHAGIHPLGATRVSIVLKAHYELGMVWRKLLIFVAGLGLKMMHYPTACRFAASRPTSWISGWTAFWESAGLGMEKAALPAARLSFGVFRITQVRLEGRGRDGPPLSRRAPAPLLSCMVALLQRCATVPVIRKR